MSTDMTYEEANPPMREKCAALEAEIERLKAENKRVEEINNKLLNNISLLMQPNTEEK